MRVMPLFVIICAPQALKMLSAISIKPNLYDIKQGRQRYPVAAAGQSQAIAAQDLIDYQAQQQVAALGALVAILLQLQVRSAVWHCLPCWCSDINFQWCTAIEMMTSTFCLVAVG